jgi:hypothetical protein
VSTSEPPRIDGWGFYDIDAEHYHSDPAPRPSMSSGLLATVISQTVAAAKETHPRLGPPKTEEDLQADREKKYDLGTVAHTLVLGVGREIVVIDEPDWKKKTAQEARKAAFVEGKTPCLIATYEKAEAMRDALMLQLADMPDERDTFAEGKGVAEQAGFWQEQTPLGRMWGRALYDWRSTDSGRLIVRDYKTYGGQNGADPDGFIKGLIAGGRDIQDPWYSRGAAAIVGQQTGEQLTWEDVDFRFIVQDPNPPYLVAAVALDDRAWSSARCQWAIDRWAAAAGANLWRGFSPVTHYVPPPTWARIQWEERVLNEWEAEQSLLAEGRPALALKEPDAYRVPDPEQIQGEPA